MERLTEITHRGTVHLKGTVANYSRISYECKIPEGLELLKKALEKLAEYEDAEENDLLVRLPCRVGDMVYVSSKIVPSKDLEEEKIPLYFSAKVVSIRQNSKGWFLKLSIKAEWLHEWIDDETGLESAYYETKKYFTYSMGCIDKTVFLTQAEAEAKLKEMEGE